MSLLRLASAATAIANSAAAHTVAQAELAESAIPAQPSTAAANYAASPAPLDFLAMFSRAVASDGRHTAAPSLPKNAVAPGNPSEPAGSFAAPASPAPDLAPAVQNLTAAPVKSEAAATLSRRASADLSIDPQHPRSDGVLILQPASSDPLLAAAATQASPSTHSAIAASPTTDGAAASALPQQPAVPLAGIPLLIAGKAAAGSNHFDIRLDPPELGRIEVHLKVEKDGRVSSHLVADRADTLALLRRDEGSLERALQDAGLKTSGDSLQFSLRDRTGGERNDQPAQPQVLPSDESGSGLDAASIQYRGFIGRSGGLDIRV